MQLHILSRIWLTILLFQQVLCQESAKRSPNILLILADDLGFGDLSSLGHPSSSTPNLDKLAANSRIFTDFYISSPVCSPSRASLLTGLYPVSTGIWPGVFFPEDVGGLDPGRFDTLATLLKDGAGYRTAHIGKWHLGVGKGGKYLPTRHGFDSYLGIPYSHDMCPCPVCFPNNETCKISCHDEYVGCPLLDGTKVAEQPTSFPVLTEKYTARALQFIAEAQEGNSTTPFFLYLAYHHTHHPQFAGARFRNSTTRGAFGDALAEMDHSVGVILSSLRRLGIHRETLVFFTSDNGPSLGRGVEGGCAGLLRCGKGTTWEGGVRVPALAHRPGWIRRGTEHGLFAAIDLAPTFLALANISTKGRHFHGKDQSLLLQGKGKSSREEYAYFPQAPDPAVGIYAVRYKNYKAHFYTQGAYLSDDHNPDHACRSSSQLERHDPPLLFNLGEDPGERHPLDPAKYGDIIEEVRQLRENMTKEINWAPSEINRGKSKKVEICCSNKKSIELCKPFPKCCDCPCPRYNEN